MKKQALKYLGYTGENISDEINELLDDCIEEVNRYANFKVIYRKYDINEIPIDLNFQPINDLLNGCDACILIGCTLGHQLEQRIRYYSKFDQAKMVVLDAISSSFIEEQCDLFEEGLKLEKRTFRFCPGYDGTPLSINREIARVLDLKKLLGIDFTETDLMIPQKTMIGIIGLGKNSVKRHCNNCVNISNCTFREAGTRCYKID